MIHIAIFALALPAAPPPQTATEVVPSVSGRVEHSGKPVANAEVHVVCRRFPFRNGRSALTRETLTSTIKTGADGRFVARVPGFRFVSIYARSGELTSSVVDRVKAPTSDLVLTLEAKGVLGIQFVRRGAPVRTIVPVRLMRTKTGESIAPLVVEAAAGRGGRVDFEGLPQANWQLFTGSSAYRLRSPTNLQCSEEVAEVELERCIALRGLVTGPGVAGEPVAGVDFELLDSAQFFEGRSTADGIVALTGLKRGPGATLHLARAGYRRAIVALEPGLDPRDDPPHFRLVCKKGGSARGRLVDEQGKGIAGADVLFRCDIHTTGVISDDLSIVSKTDSEGRFGTGALDPGAYFSVHYVEADGTPQRLCEFHPSRKTDLGEFRAGEARVRAKVSATKGLDVGPLELRIYGSKESGRWNVYEKLVPAADGYYFGPSLVAGEYFVMALSKTHGMGRRIVRVRRGKGAPMVFDVDLPLAAPRKITGQVLDPAGRPAPGVRVMLVPEGGDDEGGSTRWADIVAVEVLGEHFPGDKHPRQVKTDAKGNFVLWCFEATGRYDILAKAGDMRRPETEGNLGMGRATNVLGRPNPIILRLAPR